MKASVRALIPSLALTTLSALGGLLIWDQLPEIMPVHFDIHGTADGHAPKAVAIFALPAVSLLVTLFISLIVHAEPTLQRDQDGPPSVAKLMSAISLLLLGLQAGILLTALYPESLLMNMLLVLSMGLFMIVFGLAMRRLPMNPWIGFRYPWNRNNRAVWRRTHDLYYRWFIVFGVMSIAAAFIAPLPVISLSLLLFSFLIPAVISYRFAKQGPPQREGGHRRHGRRPYRGPRPPQRSE